MKVNPLLGLGLVLLFLLTLRPIELFDSAPPPSTAQPQPTPLPTWAVVLIIILFAFCLILPILLLFISPRTFFAFMFLHWLFYND
jgi:hypothetical protein